jgi:DNA modification methylase
MRRYENVEISKLIPYENNAKVHPEEQVQQIANSIKEFGFINPVLIDSDYGIIAGHGRVLGATKLGMTEVPCLFVEDLTDEQKRAYIIADNKLTENAEWDFEILRSELTALDDLDFDISLTGFTLDDIKVEELEPEVTEDDYEVEVPEEPKAKLGDIYQLGNHRLMCGDSTSIDDVEKLMNGNKSNMVFTDPPYGYNYQSNMRTKTEKFDVLMNDDKILDFMTPLKIVNDGFVFVCTTWKVLDKWIPLFNEYYDLSNMIIWNKGGGGIGDLKHTFSTDYEIILCSNNEKEITGKRIGSVWSIGKDNANDYIHATQKPVELSATAIKNVTKENDNVLDLFGGSGSTLIACEQLNRNCYMMELDPKYVDVIINRWEQYTGKKAELLNDSSSN